MRDPPAVRGKNPKPLLRLAPGREGFEFSVWVGEGARERGLAVWVGLGGGSCLLGSSCLGFLARPLFVVLAFFDSKARSTSLRTALTLLLQALTSESRSSFSRRCRQRHQLYPPSTMAYMPLTRNPKPSKPQKQNLREPTALAHRLRASATVWR